MDFLLSQNKNKNKTIIFDDTCLIASYETQFLAHTRLVHFLLTLSFQTHPKQTKNPNQRCQSPFSLNSRQLFSAVSLEKRSSSKTIRFGYNPLDFLSNQNRSRPYEFEFAFSATRPQNFFYKRELVQYIDRDLIDTQLASPEKVLSYVVLKYPRLKSIVKAKRALILFTIHGLTPRSLFKSKRTFFRVYMFTNSQRQVERTGKYGTPRVQYLQELVTQFQNASAEETKERIVANLANFAYDPFNFTFLRQLNVIELFLDCLTEPSEKLVEFGIGGICNACADPANAALVTQNDGIPLVIQCLSSSVRNTVNYALGALYYLCNASNKEEILKPEVIDAIKSYAAAGGVSTSFSNLAQAFLDQHVPQLN